MKKITLMIFVLLAFISKGNAQLTEGFEGATFPPTGWTSFVGLNGLGTVHNWTTSSVPAYVHSGATAAFVRYEGGTGGINEDWLVTPQITVTAPNTLLSFYERQIFSVDYGTEYKVLVSTTSQTDISSFTVLDTKTEADLQLVMTARGVDLSAYEGQQIYIAFVMSQDDGDDWAIDDVSLVPNVSLPDCATMTNPTDLATNIPVGPLVTFTWDAPTTGDAPDSYYLYVGTALPLTATDLTGNYTTNSADLNIPSYNTTYYWMVIPRNLAGDAVGCSTFSFTSEMSPGYCLQASNGQYPSTTFTSTVCDGVTEEVIVADGYAGEYSLVNVIAGNQYQFLSSNPTDFITIGSEDGLTALAYGATPVTWTATLTGPVRFYTHVDNQCGEEAANRTRSLICSGVTLTAPECAVLTSPVDGATNIPVGPIVTFTWDAPTTGDAPDSYDFYGGIALPLTAADLIGNFTTTSASLNIPSYNTTFYWMVIPKNSAGEAMSCSTFSFTSEMSPGYCLTASNGQYPSATFTSTVCDGVTEEVIVADGYAGEYSLVNVIAGNQYQFLSSNPTDFITIGSEDGLTALAYGVTPVTWTATTTEIVRFYTHIDDQCGEEAVNRTRSIICTDGSLGTPTFAISALKAFPNPVKDILNLSSNTTISKVQVYNLLGQEVFTKSLEAAQNQIDLSNLTTGTYFVKVSSENQVKTIKIIKQ